MNVNPFTFIYLPGAFKQLSLHLRLCMMQVLLSKKQFTFHLKYILSVFGFPGNQTHSIALLFELPVALI